MTPEAGRELKTWAQYFAIAFLAEMLAFWNAFMPDGRSGDMFDFREFARNQYLDYEQPRLWYWFVAFTVLAAIRFSIFYLVHRRKSRL